MKRLLYAVIIAGISILMVWILKQAFPKNTGVLNLFLLLLFTDTLLWAYTRKELRLSKKTWRIVLTIMFWLPFCMAIGGIICSFFSTFYKWPLFVKTYLTSFILIAYVTRIIPFLLLLLALAMEGILVVTDRWFSVPKAWSGVAKYLFRSGWLTGLLAFLVALSGMIFWEHSFEVRTTEIASGRLPKSFDGLRIVHISDIHLGSWNRKSKLQELVEIVNSLDPDLIFFTGDLCNFSTADALPFYSVLKKITARHGIFAVMGNHDYGDYMTWSSIEAKQENIRNLELFYSDMGWSLLRNENRSLILEGDTMAIVGVENWGAEKRFQRLANLPEAVAGTETIPFKLLLSHDPTYWDSIVSDCYPSIDITLSGHTHGGQVGIDTKWLRWSPVQYLYPSWMGLYSKTWPDGREQFLYVNRGAGTIGYAGRLGIWAEISVILLKRSSS